MSGRWLLKLARKGIMAWTPPLLQKLNGAKVARCLLPTIRTLDQSESEPWCDSRCCLPPTRSLRGFCVPQKTGLGEERQMGMLNCTVEWTERRDPEQSTFVVIADNLDGQWSFFERSPKEARWYEIPVTPQRIFKAQQLAKQPTPCPHPPPNNSSPSAA